MQGLLCQVQVCSAPSLFAGKRHLLATGGWTGPTHIGPNVIEVEVTAADGTVSSIYNVQVRHLRSGFRARTVRKYMWLANFRDCETCLFFLQVIRRSAERDLFLQQLTVLSASGAPWLYPGFNPTRSAYAVAIPHRDSQAALKFIAPQNATSVQLQQAGQLFQTLTPLNGQWTTTSMINVTVGSVTTISLIVTAEVS
jgi:hypothetical protein